MSYRFGRHHRFLLLPLSALAVGASAPALWAGRGSVEAGATRASVGAVPASTNATTKKGAVRKVAAARIRVNATRSAALIGILPTVIQTLNNCGPASVSSVLSYWRIYRTQAETAAFVRADNSIWGMSPTGLSAYARTLGLRALVGFGGTERLVKALISNGFPVIVSQYVSSYDQTRHYRPIYAYDDRTQSFVSADPYLGAGHIISYAEFNAIWADTDYRFQIIYPPSRQAQLEAVLASAGWSRTRTYGQAASWQQSLMRSPDLQTPGTWLWANGYIDLAWDQAQLGRYAAAEASLNTASRLGDSSVLIGWVQTQIGLLRQGSS
jgi:predicted double-glycine peptidase